MATHFDLLQYAKGKLTIGEQKYKENISNASSNESTKVTWKTWWRMEEWRIQEREWNREGQINNDNSNNIKITPGLSLDIAKTCKEKGGNPAILNFANQLAPGQPAARLAGNTQEEQLLKQTSLGATLKSKQYPIDDIIEDRTKEYYYKDHGLIYSPQVMVFYDDNDNKPIKNKWETAIITSAAIMCPKKKGGSQFANESDFQTTFQKALMIATIAQENKHDIVIIGLWGLGAFDNPTEDMAIIWRKVASIYPSLSFIFPMGNSGRRHAFFDYLVK